MSNNDLYVEENLSPIDFGLCEKCLKDLRSLIQCQYCLKCTGCCECSENPLE